MESNIINDTAETDTVDTENQSMSKFVYEEIKEIEPSEIGSIFFIDFYTEINTKIAAFDLDLTLITTKSKQKYATDENDWEWCYPNVIEKLQEVYKSGFKIVIICNQMGLSNKKMK